ncbi:MAG: hypothetical protein QW566_06795 [Candidatus Jordarchaeales archaeon]
MTATTLKPRGEGGLTVRLVEDARTGEASSIIVGTLPGRSDDIYTRRHTWTHIHWGRE